MYHRHKYDHKEEHAQSTLERTISVALSPVASFIYKQSTSFILLLIASLSSIIIINLYDSQFINAISKSTAGFYFNSLSYTMTIKEWLNCGLMTIFFMFIGLEIKREVFAGKLKNKNEVMFICFCAIGGMFVPSFIYIALNYADVDYINGWIITISTDTVFALGILSLLSRTLTIEALVVFSVLVIFDDICSVILSILVSEQIHYTSLVKGMIMFSCLILVNQSGIRSNWVYISLGVLFWYYIHEANVHTSFAGLLIAYSIPVKPYISHKKFINVVDNILVQLEDDSSHESKEHLKQELNTAIDEYSSPLQKWEDRMALPVFVFILPMFYFLNSDVQISIRGFYDIVSSSVAWGIILGLIIGKPLGIICFAIIAKKANIGIFPNGLSNKDFLGVALLAGVGFTMSIYHAEHVFNNNDSLLQITKFSILLTSIISSLLSAGYIKLINKTPGATSINKSVIFVNHHG